MKTKVFFSIVVLMSLIVFFSSCESKSGKRVVETEKASTPKVDTLIFSPEKIGVTELVKEFIPYPQYDGGTGIEASFSAGIQFKGKIYEIKSFKNTFFREEVSKEKAESDKRIADVVLTHYLLSNTPKQSIDVFAINGEIVKITRRSAFIADEFYPSKIIWEEK